MKEDDPDAMVALLRFIYDLPFEGNAKIDITSNEDELLLPYTQVYIAADKYQVEGLKLAVSNTMKRIIDTEMDFDEDPCVDDFLETLRVIVTHTTPQDQLARKVVVEACVMNLQCIRKRPELLSLLSDSTELVVEIICHQNLECGFPGAWFCESDCDKPATIRCWRCKVDFKKEFAWLNRNVDMWTCPRCASRAKPRCYACGSFIKWVSRGLK